MSNKINDILNEVKDAIEETRPINENQVFENNIKVDEIEKSISVFSEKISLVESKANKQEKFVEGFISNEISAKEKLVKELTNLKSDINSLRVKINNIEQDEEKIDAMVNRIEKNVNQIECLENQLNSIENKNNNDIFLNKLKILEEKLSVIIPFSNEEFFDETNGMFQQILDIKQNISNVQTLFNKNNLTLSNKIDSNARKNNNFEFLTKTQLSDLEEKINELNTSPYFEDLREKILDVDKRIFSLEETNFSDSDINKKIKNVEESVESLTYSVNNNEKKLNSKIKDNHNENEIIRGDIIRFSNLLSLTDEKLNQVIISTETYSTEASNEFKKINLGMEELVLNDKKIFDLEVEYVEITKEIELLKENKKNIDILLNKFDHQEMETENVKSKILQIIEKLPADLQKQLLKLKTSIENAESKLSSYSTLLPRINEVSESNLKNTSKIFNIEHEIQIDASKISNLNEKMNIFLSLIESQKNDLYNLNEIVSSFSDLSAKYIKNSDSILSLEQKTKDVNSNVDTISRKLKEVSSKFTNYLTSDEVKSEIFNSETKLVNYSTNKEVDNKISEVTLETQKIDNRLNDVNSKLDLLSESLNVNIGKIQIDTEEISLSLETLGNGFNSLNTTLILSNESYDSKLNDVEDKLNENITSATNLLSERISDLEDSENFNDISLKIDNYISESSSSSDKLRKRVSNLENNNTLDMRLRVLEDNNDLDTAKTEISRIKKSENDINENIRELKKNSNDLSLEIDLINYKIENPNTSDIDKLFSKIQILEYANENQNLEVIDDLKTKIEILAHEVSNPDTSKNDEIKLKISNIEYDINLKNKKIDSNVKEINDKLHNTDVNIELIKTENSEINGEILNIKLGIDAADEYLQNIKDNLLTTNNNVELISNDLKEYNLVTNNESEKLKLKVESMSKLLNELKENNMNDTEDADKIKNDIIILNEKFLDIKQDLEKQSESTQHVNNKILKVENDLNVKLESGDKKIKDMLIEYENKLKNLKIPETNIKVDYDVQVKKIDDKYMFDSRTGGFNIAPGFNGFQNKLSRTASTFMADDSMSFYFNNKVNFKSAKFHEAVEMNKIETQKISTKNIYFTESINGYSIDDLLNKASFSTSKFVESNMSYSFDVPKIVTRVELIDSLGFCIPSSYETFVWSWSDGKLIIKFFEKISRSESGEILTSDSIVINVYS